MSDGKYRVTLFTGWEDGTWDRSYFHTKNSADECHAKAEALAFLHAEWANRKWGYVFIHAGRVEKE
jgi:hypothetical protein